MSQLFYEQTQCQTCLRQFRSQIDLRQHIEQFRCRIQYLIAELHKALAHSSIPDDESNDRSEEDAEAFYPINDPLKDEDDRHGKFICPHSECENKPKTLFKKWKNFVRHYTIHVTCDETCTFCGCHISRVRKYVTHYDDCKAKKTQEENGKISIMKQGFVIQQRKRLCRMAADELDLKMTTMAEIRNEEVSYGEGSNESVSRKRPQEETTPEELHRLRKRRSCLGNGAHTNSLVSSDMAHQALSRYTYPAQPSISMSSGHVAPTTTGTITTSLMSNCARRDNAALDSFNGEFPLENTGCAPYTSSDGAFISHFEPLHTRAPLLFSHTMDGSSTSQNFSEGQLASSHARAPLLSSHTMDGYPSVNRQILSAQAKMPSMEHHAAISYQSNPQPLDDGMTALYGTSQPILPNQGIIGYM